MRLVIEKFTPKRSHLLIIIDKGNYWEIVIFNLHIAADLGEGKLLTKISLKR